jgi:hypothetical protein
MLLLMTLVCAPRHVNVDAHAHTRPQMWPHRSRDAVSSEPFAFCVHEQAPTNARNFMDLVDCEIFVSEFACD